jgi:hypothetical protein
MQRFSCGMVLALLALAEDDMGTWHSKLIALTALGVLAVGCGEDPLDEDRDVRTWVNTGSAVAVYMHGYDLIGAADGEVTFDDPACPVVEDDGTTLTVTGDGCTDTMGREWLGSARVIRGSDGSRTAQLDGFAKVSDPDFRVPVTGDFVVRSPSATMHEFEADLVAEGGSTVTITYAGTVEGTYDGRTVWNGSGEVERDGFGEPNGTALMSTENEVLDSSVCMGQAVSGTTTIRSEGRVAVVTYDGATDCDEDQAATWTLDGEDQGKVTGITCM